MKIALVNHVTYGSTGNIMLQIADTARRSGYEVKTFSTNHYFAESQSDPSHPDHFVWGTSFESRCHHILGKLSGWNGRFSRRGTRALIRELSAFKPDIVHLHILHSFCVNLPLLFRYLKESGVKVVWTFHDCWAFTGKCPHFAMVGCDKWLHGCGSCPQLHDYPRSLLDTTKSMYKKKQAWFTSLEKLTIVTPSEWLANLVKQSFLKDYPTKVIHNGIDLSVFRPTESDFRKKYHCEDKKILLGVSFGWSNRKGLDMFIDLANRLDSARCQIVLVGTNEATDALLPPQIISIHRTQDQKELAEIYSVADLFLNPTREDTFPTVNMESLACGTPVLTFRTGGSPEIIDDACGAAVDVDDIDALEAEIYRICDTAPYSRNACLNKALNFDKYDRFADYVMLYEELLKK